LTGLQNLKANLKETNNMVKPAPRFLLVFASMLLVAGSIFHAVAFNRAVAAVSASNLPAFFGNTFKALWLADSTTLFLLAAVFGLIAARPSAASRPVVALLAFVPAALAVLIYTFLGNFFAGHILVVTAAAVFLASVRFHKRPMARQFVS
jgi:hypothetical protein